MPLTQRVNWISEFFEKISNRLTRILSAGGCRELWLQGEIYLYLDDSTVKTNATLKKYDVYKENSFILEIKLLGGNYQKKVISRLEDDFKKLADHSGLEQKYMLLVLDNQCQNTTLYDQLYNYQHSSGKQVFYKDYRAYCVLLWRVS